MRRILVAGLVLAASQVSAQTPGERVFQQCFACHSVDKAEAGLPGPNLAGVVGRRAGREAGFDYSPAMKEAAAGGLTWTPETLDRFLTDPEQVVPKTSMHWFGLKDPAERAAVIGYLREKP